MKTLNILGYDCIIRRAKYSSGAEALLFETSEPLCILGEDVSSNGIVIDNTVLEEYSSDAYNKIVKAGLIEVVDAATQTYKLTEAASMYLGNDLEQSLTELLEDLFTWEGDEELNKFK